MATKILSGDAIEYSCIPLRKEDYDSWMVENDPEPCVLGVVSKGFFYPAEDLTIQCKNHWSLPILENYYEKHWIIIAKHPGHVLTPMAEITNQDIYTVQKYDVWYTPSGLAAVVTEVDED